MAVWVHPVGDDPWIKMSDAIKPAIWPAVRVVDVVVREFGQLSEVIQQALAFAGGAPMENSEYFV